MKVKSSSYEVSEGHGQHHEGVEQGDPCGAVRLAGNVGDVGVAQGGHLNI